MANVSQSLSLSFGWFYSTPCWYHMPTHHTCLPHQKHLTDFYEINTFHEVSAFTTCIVQSKIVHLGFLSAFLRETRIMNWYSYWEHMSCPYTLPHLLSAPVAVHPTYLVTQLGLNPTWWPSRSPNLLGLLWLFLLK